MRAGPVDWTCLWIQTVQSIISRGETLIELLLFFVQPNVFFFFGWFVDFLKKRKKKKRKNERRRSRRGRFRGGVVGSQPKWGVQGR